MDVEELRAASRVLDECRKELEGEGKKTGPLEVGVMTETPAAAICAARLAPEVAFFSIGTNDLVQYTLAADRGNERLRHLQSADHPAVLQLIKQACEAVREAGIWVGVRGEAVGEPALIPQLVELGVGELSVSTLDTAGKEGHLRTVGSENERRTHEVREVPGFRLQHTQLLNSKPE